MRFSLIVPMYNVEKYIYKCVDSIVTQGFTDYEVICVDDGCTDNTVRILKDNFASHPNVTLLSKENGGLSSARNAGFAKATGEYVLFIDSDDCIKADLLDTLDKHIREFKSDIISFGVERVSESGKVLSVEQLYKNGLIEKSGALITFAPSVWNKVFKKTLVNDLLFPEGIIYEDMPYTITSLALSSSISTLDFVGYEYLQREGSLINTFDSRIFDIYKSVEYLIESFNKFEIYEEYYKYIEYNSIIHIVLGHLSRCASEKDGVKRKQYCVDAFNFMHTKFPGYEKNEFLRIRTNDSLLLYIMKRYCIKLLRLGKFWLILNLYRFMLNYNLIKLKRW